MLNNVVPEEFTNHNCKNYIDPRGASVTHLKVMPKSEWLAHKQSVKEIRKEVAAMKPAESVAGGMPSKFEEGCLIKLINLPEIKKTTFTEKIKHFG